MSDVNFTIREQEYWFHVSPQEALPLAGQVNIDFDLNKVSQFFKDVKAADQNLLRETTARLLLANTGLFSEIRQFLGISDKRAYLDLSYISSRMPHPNATTALCGCDPWSLARHPLTFFINMLNGAKGADVQKQAALMMADYLLKHGLMESAPSFAEMPISVLKILYARLISPKEYQQRAAKRRGHGCEAALATILYGIGLDITPADKASNPMGARDPNVNLANMQIVDRLVGKTHSFDMVIKQQKNARILIQSLIHTSDPGQYGVNKSDETVSIIRDIRKWTQENNTRPVELWALLDGVGFSENKPDTINKLLANVDYFVQIQTLYKAALRAHALGLTKINAIRFSRTYSTAQIAQLTALYVPNGVVVLKGETQPQNGQWRSISAGHADIYID